MGFQYYPLSLGDPSLTPAVSSSTMYPSRAGQAIFTKPTEAGTAAGGPEGMPLLFVAGRAVGAGAR